MTEDPRAVSQPSEVAPAPTPQAPVSVGSRPHDVLGGAGAFLGSIARWEVLLLKIGLCPGEALVP